MKREEKKDRREGSAYRGERNNRIDRTKARKIEEKRIDYF